MKVYLVGGAVREHLLGRTGTKDYDFAVEGATYVEMVSWLKNILGATIWLEHSQFFTVRCKVDLAPFGNFGGLVPSGVIDADFALCREEAGYTDHRRPDAVYPASIYTDLTRRDFTVNAAAIAEDGKLIDPHGAKYDADHRVLRTVGDPTDRFTEDPLRILRAFRFHVTHEMWFSSKLSSALNSTKTVDMVHTLPVERVREELTRAMKHNWVTLMRVLMVHYPEVPYILRRHFPDLWFKPSTEQR